MRCLVVHRVWNGPSRWIRGAPMNIIPQVTFGEEFRWHFDRGSVHRSCILNEGHGRIRRIEIYISKEALMDAQRLTETPKEDKLVNLAKQLWENQILPVVIRQIRVAAWDSDGSLRVTSAELREQRRPAPD